MQRSRLIPATALVLGVMLAGCTSGATLGSSGTVTLTTSASAATDRRPSTAGTPTSITPTPVTPDGLVTGTGVDDTTITLGLLVDAATDRGFSAGVALWQRGVNVGGGICGRTVDTVSNGSESTTAAYPRIAASTLGLLTEPDTANTAALVSRVSADQVPTLTASGSSATLTSTGPVVIAATADIQAINALAYLRSTGRLAEGSTLGTLTDSSATAANALAGARWWAETNKVQIQSRTVDAQAVSGWPEADAVLVMADAAHVQATLDATAAPVPVVTGVDGFAGVTRPGGRLLVGLPAPAYGSDNPGAAAVAKAFVATGRTDPGPELMPGYGVAAAWGRLLTRACTDRTLTRAGIRAAMTTVGPASVDSLFGPSDPALVVRQQLPATRVSSVALADPAAPAGLRPLIWLQAAPGIADYQLAR